MDVGATAKISASGVKMLPGVAQWLRQKRRLRQEAAHTKKLLGVDQSMLFNYRVSMDHPLLQHGTPHADDLSAFAAVAGPTLVRAFANGWTEYPEDIEANLNEGMVLIGSPESEALTRLAFGYRKSPESGRVEYVGDVLDLPFRWQEDIEAVSAECHRFVPGKGLVRRPNWPIVDNTGFRPKQLFPTVSNDGLLTSDFLLITKVPNFLTSEAQQSGRSIVSIAGSHGVGTRAIGVVLRDQRILSELAEKIPAGSHAFQVLIEARSVVHDPSLGSRARGAVVREVRCFDRPDDAWARARRNVLRRYTDWASDVQAAQRANPIRIE